MTVNFFRDQNGQGTIEYGLIIFLVGIVLIIGLTLFGSELTSNFNSSTKKLP